MIITQSLPDGEVGKPYFALLEARDGVEPIVWSIESGVLPDGLTLNSASGEISGIPQKDGSFDFVVRATDANGNTATKGFTIKILLPFEVNVTLRVNNGDGVPVDTYVALGVDASADIKTTGNAGTGVYSYTFTGSDVNTTKFITVACNNLSPVELKTIVFKPVLINELVLYCGKQSSTGGTISGNITVSAPGNQWTVFTQGGADSSTDSGAYTMQALSGLRDVVAVEYGSSDKFAIRRDITVNTGSDTPNIHFDFANPANYYLFSTTISGTFTQPPELSNPSFSGVSVHLITKNGMLTNYFVFGIMSANPSGNSYTISAPEPSALITGEEYVLSGGAAKTGPPNSSVEAHYKITPGASSVTKDITFLSPPTLLSPANSSSVNRTPTFSWNSTDGAGAYKLLIYDSGTFKDTWSVYVQPVALQDPPQPSITLPDLYSTSGFDPSWGLQTGKKYSWYVTIYDTEIYTFLLKGENPFPDIDMKKSTSSGFSFSVQ